MAVLLNLRTACSLLVYNLLTLRALYQLCMAVAMAVKRGTIGVFP